MNHSFEEDRLQCQSLTQSKKRCTRIGQFSCGGKVLCTEHHQLAMVKRANDALIERKKSGR